MALFNRWQVSNFLDSRGGKTWDPDLVGEILDFGGASAAVVMSNGTGKTSIADAVLFTLSLDQSLLERTKARIAPDSFGYYTHVRVEFIIPASAAQLDLADLGNDRQRGECHVFGIYASRKPGNQLDYDVYYYAGTLEDVPVHEEVIDDGGRVMKRPVGDQEFLDVLRRQSDYRVFKPKQNLHGHLESFLLLEQRDALVSYQKRGSGDKSANFYDVSPRSGQSYDQAFFYRVVAPVVLANQTADDDEQAGSAKTLETEVVGQADAVIEAKLQTEAFADQIARLDRVCRLIGELDNRAAESLRRETAMRDSFRDKGLPIEALRRIVEEGVLPGGPLARPQSYSVHGFSLADCALRPGGPVAMEVDAALRMLGMNRTNVGRQDYIPDAQVIPLAVTHLHRGRSAKDRREYVALPVLYDWVATQLSGDARRTAEERLGVVLDAVRAAAFHPLRAAEEKARIRIDELEGAKKNQRSILDAASRTLTELLEDRASMEANQAAFEDLMGSPVLTDEEKVQVATLPGLNTVRGAVTEELKAARASVEALSVQHATFEAKAPLWRSVRQTFGDGPLSEIQRAESEKTRAAEVEAGRRRDRYSVLDRRLTCVNAMTPRLDKAVADLNVRQNTLLQGQQSYEAVQADFGPEADPSAVLASLRKATNDAEQAVKDHDAAVRRALDTKTNADSAARDAKGVVTQSRSRLETMKIRAEAHAAFTARVPGRDPHGFEAALRAEISVSKQRKSAAELAIAELTPLADALEQFRAGHTVAPSLWLADVVAERDQLAVQAKSLAEGKGRLESRLARLRQTRVAPTEINLAADALLEGLPGRPLHSVIAGLELSSEARLDLLSALSAVLHAPVFETAALAEQAARILEEHDIPVPVFVIEDVRRLATGPVRRDGELRRQLLAGVPTATVELILDPAAVERRIAAFEADISAAAVKLEACILRQAEIAEDASGVLLARQAKRAEETDAAGRLDTERRSLADADEVIRMAEALLVRDLIELAGQAARFLDDGGAEGMLSLSEDLAVAEDAEAAALEAFVMAEAVIAELDDRRPQIEGAADAARATVTRWSDVCERAATFLGQGGVQALAEARRQRSLVDRKRRRLEDVLARVRASRSTADAVKDAASLAASNAKAFHAEWSAPLNAAINFEREGGPPFLAAWADTLRGARDREALADRRSRLPFEKALSFVEHGGPQGLNVIDTRISEAKTAKTGAEQALEKLDDLIPDASAAAHSARGALTAYEKDLLAVVHQYPSARAILGQHEHRAVFEEVMRSVSEAEHPLVAKARAIAAAGAEDMPALIADLEEALRNVDVTAAADALDAAFKAHASARKGYSDELLRLCRGWEQQAPGGFGTTLERLRLEGEDPSKVRALSAELQQQLSHQRGIHEAAAAAEERSREKLADLLIQKVAAAAESINTLATVLRRGTGATFILENAEPAGEGALRQLVIEIVEKVFHAKRRHRQDVAEGMDGGRDAFSGGFRSDIRRLLYERIFPGARIKVRHPLMRDGHDFFMVRNGVSGGQATALNLLWAIKLATFAVERGSAHLRGSKLRQARTAMQSIIVVDGLFSDLSDHELIRESLAAMKEIKGNFQLIGLIHSPYYRNDWEFFPTCLNGRRVGTLDENGRASSMVVVTEDERPSGSRVAFTGARAVSLLGTA